MPLHGVNVILLLPCVSGDALPFARRCPSGGEERASLVGIEEKKGTREDRGLNAQKVVLISLIVPRPTWDVRGLKRNQGCCARFRPSTSFYTNHSHCLGKSHTEEAGGTENEENVGALFPPVSSRETTQACDPTTALTPPSIPTLPDNSYRITPSVSPVSSSA